MKKNFVILAVCSLLVGGGIITLPSETDASVRNFSNIKLTFNAGEKQAGSTLKKTITSKSGALNLRNDGGDAWINGRLVNSNGELRGRVNVQRGKRATFSHSAKKNYNCKMIVSKENPGTVTIKGSWTADN
ncbi:hypothetical protein MM221_05485 [Salipaludibacillus sp. LMS25]|uniref:hypothetical protein n=1 Tax=Salipaludibacillus sp. LMS25 TaxID=2924031 RepID=UPI0020D06630|nr:hypothetical protein [Salipaludibacillus sp. LMS25]UTR16013.1 hypothetical protein MM221_05485 [Salipaludibacillus sp. LMS25]